MPINGKATYYEFFGLANFEPDQQKIKSAYRSMALHWHPDRCKDKARSGRMMQQINEVYRVLSTKKDQYDEHLRAKDSLPHWYDEAMKRFSKTAREVFLKSLTDDEFHAVVKFVNARRAMSL